MTATAVRAHRGAFGAVRSSLRRREPDVQRVSTIGVARFVMATVFVMVALAVTLQAQRVTGQDTIEGLLAETTVAEMRGAELSAQVAAAESPAEVLAAAQSMGMVQPAAVVAVPAIGGDQVSARSDGGPVG